MKIRDGIFYAAVAFCLGIGLSYMWRAATPEEKWEMAEKDLRLTAPEQEAAPFDAFSVNLLKAAMETQTAGNTLVAPDSLAALLGRLKGLSEGSAADALESLHLSGELAFTSADVRELALLFPEITTPLQPEVEVAPDVVRVPYKQALSEAFIAINRNVSLMTEAMLDRTAGSDTVTSDTSFLVLNGIVFKEEWMHTVREEDTVQEDFFNGNGAMPRVPMMRHRGAFRVARAENGEWEAVALFFRNVLDDGDSACLVAVLPKESSARSFVQNKLSPEMLAEIRQALYKAEPEPCTIAMPRLMYPAVVVDMHPIYSRLGLGSLFMEASPFPRLTPASPFHLDRALQQCMVTLVESEAVPTKEEPQQESSDKEYPESLRFDRPFVWFIGDLTSPRPPYLMGIVEDL